MGIMGPDPGLNNNHINVQASVGQRQVSLSNDKRRRVDKIFTSGQGYITAFVLISERNGILKIQI